jgi:hypothetical protein
MGVNFFIMECVVLVCEWYCAVSVTFCNTEVSGAVEFLVFSAVQLLAVRYWIWYVLQYIC